MDCLERVVKYVSQHAYIEIALKSCGFFTGAYNATSLILSNALRLGILHGLCQVVVTFGVASITAITVLVGFLLIRHVEYFRDSVTGYLAPLAIIALIGWFVASLFAHVFQVASDAIIHCYITDENENGRPTHSTIKLSSVIEEAKIQRSSLLMEGGFQDDDFSGDFNPYGNTMQAPQTIQARSYIGGAYR